MRKTPAPRSKAAAKPKVGRGNHPNTQRNHFKKGQNTKRGPNKLTRDLKEGIIDAAVAIGIDGKGGEGLVGYLKMLAKKHPKQYTSLLARVMPLQISGDLGLMIGAVNIVPVPVDRFLSSDDIKRLQPPDENAVTIDVVPNTDEEEVA